MAKAPPDSHTKQTPSSLTVTRRFEGSRDAVEVLTSLMRLHSGKEAAYAPFDS